MPSVYRKHATTNNDCSLRILVKERLTVKRNVPKIQWRRTILHEYVLKQINMDEFLR